MKVFVGADHRGYELKETIFQWLVDWEYEVEDMGAYEYDKSDDFTKYSVKVASIVAENEENKGILVCGSGVGVDIVANKFDGVRASIGKNTDQIRAGRNDDNMNVLILAADYTSEEEAKNMIQAFLKTSFSGKIRHRRRLEEIKRIEENN